MSPELIPVAITLILFGTVFILAEMSRWVWIIYATVDVLWVVYGSIVGAPGVVTNGIAMSFLCVYGLWRWDRKALDREREIVEGAPLERVLAAALRWRDATPAEHAHKYNNPSVELIEALDRYEGGTR